MCAGDCVKPEMGYGHAEALLYQKHPDRFTRGGRGGIRWEGCVYTGGALGVRTGDLIYTGIAGEAPYQALISLTQPTRPLPPEFDTSGNRLLLSSLRWLQQHLRPWARHRHGGPPRYLGTAPQRQEGCPVNQSLTLIHEAGVGRYHLYEALKNQGWHPSSEPDFDLTKHGSHLFAATEQTGSRTARTFVRLHVPPGTVNPGLELKSIAQELAFQITPSH